ncbi:MAG TPA: DUF202 domain-containing protein [Micromonosporaceae bacterium]
MDETGPSRNDRGLELERDYQANERTYLAWLRTSMNVMALGVAVARFGTSWYSFSAGGVLVLAATIGLIFGTARHRRVLREIRQGRLVTGTRGRAPEIASTVLILAVFTALALLFVEAV